ncbi:MAG: type II toxin-antitoxin system VapC family toxin [Gammaproteobacteria bacterium]
MAVTSLVLDTSAYTAYAKSWAAVVTFVRQAETVWMPAVVIGELRAGFEWGSQRSQNRAALNEFLRSPRVRVAAVTEATAERFAVIYASLRAAGRPIPVNDLWIAATAMEVGARLLTTDAHFRDVPQILVEFVAA